MSRLQYASDNVTLQAKNFTAANGRIVDVDIASESTNLAKYNILACASGIDDRTGKLVHGYGTYVTKII